MGRSRDDVPPPIPVATDSLVSRSSESDRQAVEQSIKRRQVHRSLAAYDPNNDEIPFVPDKRRTWERIFGTFWGRFVFCLDRRGREVYDKGFEFFERFTLPRYVVTVDDGARQSEKHKAEIGEKVEHTRLYSMCATSMALFKEFGIGVSLYFSTLLCMAGILFVTAVINIPNLTDYAGSTWSDGQQTLRTSKLGDIALIGSAYCDQTRFVSCPTCNSDDFRNNRKVQDVTTGTYYYAQNLCEMKFNWVLVDYVSIIFLFAAIIALAIFQKKLEVKFDEAKQTASDYSLTVLDPCKDATDPDEWRNFFAKYEPNGDVVCVTVSINNQALMKLLLRQRSLRHNITEKLLIDEVYDEEVGFNEQSVNCVTKILNKFGIALPVHVLHEQLMDVQRQIRQEVACGSYDAERVFVTFETEEGQRNALNALNTGLIAAWTDASNVIPIEDRFRGQNVLKVQESTEPDAVRWAEIGVSTVRKYQERTCTLLLTSAVIVGAAFLVWVINKQGDTIIAAGFISVFNTLIPIICFFINEIENHASEGGRQESLYVKIALARWANTAIIIFIITPFTDVLDKDLLYQVYAVLFADLVTYPAYRLIDPVAYLSRFVGAPLAARYQSQTSVNMWFSGTAWSVAERYTDMTKTMFLAFFYAAVYPASYVFCLVAMIVNFIVDKYCLIRMWAPHPRTGTQVAKKARLFFLLCVLAHAILSSYWWSGFPYDNLCQDSDPNGSLTQATTITTNLGATVDIPSTPEFFYCKQDLIRSGKFPALPSWQGQHTWMTSGQATMVEIVGISSAVFLGCIFFGVFGAGIFFSVKHLFVKSYYESGKTQGIGFEECRGNISAYVPQYASPLFQHPLIACPLSDVDLDLMLDWQATGNAGYDDYCLCSDRDLGDFNEVDREDLFARVKYYGKGVGNTSGKAVDNTNRISVKSATSSDSE